MAKKYIVTGGGGFLGGAICRQLASDGHQVISLARSDYPELARFGISHKRLDLSQDTDRLFDIMQSADAVFHVAAKVDMWGKYSDFYQANVVATRNIINACRKTSVSKLIYTSSPSVIADGKNLLGVNESYPYPKNYTAYYPQTKAIAEREVLQANGVGGLRTIALRPHLIWGPGDTNLVPTILAKARAGRLMRVGKGENLTDLTFIDDCVSAHLLALRALEENPQAAGRAYFISQGKPVKMWEWIDEILQYHQLPKIRRKISYNMACKIAWICEAFSKVFPTFFKEPLLTRFLVCEMATSHYFDISAARKELGYNPMLTIEQAMLQTFAQ